MNSHPAFEEDFACAADSEAFVCAEDCIDFVFALGAFVGKQMHRVQIDIIGYLYLELMYDPDQGIYFLNAVRV